MDKLTLVDGAQFIIRVGGVLHQKYYKPLQGEVAFNAIYQHKKGNLYYIWKVERDSEDLTWKVSYTDINSGKGWVRPLEMFLSPGRFTLLSMANPDLFYAFRQYTLIHPIHLATLKMLTPTIPPAWTEKVDLILK